jgi:HAD superfamily hydrolase (TIGR01450 family)
MGHMFDSTRPKKIAAISPERARALVTHAGGILLDWDGCVAVANRPSREALSFIERHVAKIAIVSNNSTLLPEDISGLLSETGVSFPSSRIFLAGVEALASATAIQGARALVLASPRMKALAHRVGMNMVRCDADVVVLLRDTRFSYAKLERVVHSLMRGARLIVANPDMTHPGAGGTVVPETGALLAAIGACVDLTRLDVQFIGKPSAVLFERACAALRIPMPSAVMIGDNLETDIEGARRLGIPAILISQSDGLSFHALTETSSAARPGIATPLQPATTRPGRPLNSLN